MAKMMYNIIVKLITGKESVKNLSGPVGIIKAIDDSSKQGFIYIANITALISLNLAIVNMLPLPALDGGRILFLIINKITGRKITSEAEGKIHFAGLILLFALMIFVTYQDIFRIFVK
jgi:regulator of sigma E protease